MDHFTVVTTIRTRVMASTQSEAEEVIKEIEGATCLELIKSERIAVESVKSVTVNME